MGFRVSEGPLVRLSLATGANPSKTGLIVYFPRAVMMASATFLGASL
jgi:hypothetical protein